MIDGRYTDEEWRTITAAVEPRGVARACAALSGELASGVRSALERAIARFRHEELLAEEMGISPASEREHWKRIEAKANELAGLITKSRYWLSPVWWVGDVENDDHAAKVKALECLRDVEVNARMNAGDLDQHSKAFARRQDPNREKLYSAVFEVWTGDLGGELTWSPNGPLVRFFRAALGPALRETTPVANSIVDIVDREKSRRAVQHKYVV